MKNIKYVLSFTVCLLSLLFFNCDTETIPIENIKIKQQNRLYNYVIKEEQRKTMFLKDEHEVDLLRLLNLTEYAIDEFKAILKRIEDENGVKEEMRSEEEAGEEETEKEEEKNIELEQQLEIIIDAIIEVRLKINEITVELEDIYTSIEPDDENTEFLNSIVNSINVLQDINSMLEAVSEMPSPDMAPILKKYFTGLFYLLRNEYRLNFYKNDILFLNLENQIARGVKEDLNIYINEEMIPQLNEILSIYWIGSNGWNDVYNTIQNMKTIANYNDNIEDIRLSFFEENQ